MNLSIEDLKAALAVSPENVPLRQLLVKQLLQLSRLDEAENELHELIKLSDNWEFKLQLAQVFYQKLNFSMALVLLEEIIVHWPNQAEVQFWYAKSLFQEKSFDKAREAYEYANALNSELTDTELDEAFKINSVVDEQEDQEGLQAKFLEKPQIDFNAVGGMDEVKKEIDLKIIKPLQNPEIYAAYGKKIGGGILMYGPPGCGKTFIAKATAGQINSKFISVSLNDILDMWIGNSEKNLHEIFELARAHQPCVLFFDEIDALGANRSDMKQSAGRNLINQFLLELDGIESSNDGVLVLGATNTPWHLDAAFRRPGRFDRILFVPPPDETSRQTIMNIKLEGKPTEKINTKELAKKSKEFSGADIEALIDIAVEQKIEESFETGIPQPIVQKDLLKAIKKHKPSTKEWFTTAKNYALFSNQSGLYDDILDYLNIKK